MRMMMFFKRLALAAAVVMAVSLEMTAGDSRQFKLDSAYLCQPFSAIDVMTLAGMEKNVDTYGDMPGFAAYKDKLARVAYDITVYDKAVSALDSPFDFNRIVGVRKLLIPLITREGYFSEAQQAEMDRLDILLSRYKGSVALFKRIIGKINSDPVVVAYRETARKGKPSGEERRKYIAAISAIVYKPSSKVFTDEINDYIGLIPYLKPRLTEYLNAIAMYPDVTPAVETEIMDLD